MIFGYHTAIFVEENLSVSESMLENLKLFKMEDDPYLHIFNAQNQLYVEIFSVTGSKLLERTPFSADQISSEQYSKKLYFIKVDDGSGRFKTFKFLKR